MAHTDKAALHGVRVLDFGWYVAVPLATRMLRDYGAEVIRVETTLRVDAVRTGVPTPPGISGVNAGMNWNNINNGKASITLNLAHTDGRELALRLVQIADVVMENYMPDVMDRYGLGYEALRRAQPDIIMLRAPMTGLTGPWSGWRAMGLGIQHISGIGYFSGYPDLPPGPIPFSFPDYCCNPYHAITAVMAALRYRRMTGKGQLIELAQYESTANFLGPAALDYSIHGRIQEREGNYSPYYAPHGVFPCAGDDRWIAIAVTDDEEWRALCRVMERKDWLSKEGYSTAQSRLKHKEDLHAVIADWTRSKDARDLMDALQRAGVPAGVVQSGKDVVEDDPQLRARGYYQKVRHPVTGEHLYDTRSAQLSKTPGRIQSHAPLLAQHNDVVYQQLLGLAEDQVNSLVVNGALD